MVIDIHSPTFLKVETMATSKLLCRRAASQYLRKKWGLSRAPSTLAKYAVVGGGPTFCRAGRVPFYSTDDLDDWVTSKLSEPMRSTSDVGAAALSNTQKAPGGRQQVDG